MNFLFITTIMILIFSLISTSMTQSLFSTQFASKHLESTYINSLCLENTMDQYKYKNTYQQKTTTEENRRLARKDKLFTPRKSCTGENSKLNLIVFTYEKNYENKKIIQKTLTNLLTYLYKNEPFIQKHLFTYPNLFTNLSSEIALGVYNTGSLSKIPFKNPKFRSIFIDLCSGSYPTKNTATSLLEYICLHEIEHKPPIILTHMSRPLLHAFFGKEITVKILKKERELYYEGKAIARIKKNQLNAIIGSTRIQKKQHLLTETPYHFKKIQKRKKTNFTELITKGSPAQ